MIAANRFKMLDQQTNVATADFQSMSSSDIFNSINNASKDVSKDVQDFLDKDTQVPIIDTTALEDKLVRSSKDAMGGIKDIGGLSGKDIDKAIGDLLSGFPQVQGLFSKLAPKCQTKGLDAAGLGKPYDLDVNCGGKKRKGSKAGCSSSEYGNILNKLTGGSYAATFADLNKALKNLIGLSKMGYDMNLCGVFSALSVGMDKDVLSRASGSLLGHLGSSGNVLGVLDLAGSSAGLHTLIENPSGISTTFKNFSVPSEIKLGSLNSFSDRLTGAMELYSDSWNQSSYDGILSTSYADGFNPQVNEVFQSKLLNNTIGLDLDVPVIDDHAFMTAAYGMNNNSDLREFI